MNQLIDADPFMINRGTALIGTTPLIMAASSNQLDTVQLLHDRGVDLYQENWYGNALHCAAEAGKTQVCQRLIELGLDPNRRSRQGSGKPPLHCTLDQDHLETFQMLIRLGADPSSVTFSTDRAFASPAIMKYVHDQGDLHPHKGKERKLEANIRSRVVAWRRS